MNDSTLTKTTPALRPWMGAGLLIVLWALLALVTSTMWRNPQALDFYPRWHGAREMLHNHNPYTLDINRTILAEMGYTEFIPYKHNFGYPATITWSLLPFWLLPYKLSVSMWGGLQLLLAFALPLAVFRLLEWDIPPRRFVMIMLASTFLYRHTFSVYLLAQFIIFILACLIAAWWLVVINRRWLAAWALVSAPIRPDGIVLAAALLFDLLLKRRFRLLILWGALMGALFALSVAWIGFWVPDFLDAMRGYRENLVSYYPPDVLGVDLLVPPFLIGVLVWGAWLLWQMRPLPDRLRIPWSLSVAILVYLLTLPQSKDYTLVYALLPAWMVLWAGRDQVWPGRFVLLIFLTTWLYPLMGQIHRPLYRLDQLLTPVLLGILLTYQWRRDHRPT